MEPLDPKAELMRLAKEFRVKYWIDRSDERRDCIALESAITLALAAERRRMVLDLWRSLPDHESIDSLRFALERGEFAAAIRTLVDGKAGGT